MKKLTKFTLLVLVIFLIKLVLDMLINSIVISNFNNGKYSTFLPKVLQIININQPYIPYYNEGTILYRLGEYEKATEKLNKALEKNPSKKYVCDVRVNLSLSMIAQIDETNCDKAPSDIKKALEILKENECIANSDAASSLATEIKELEAKIKEQCQSDDPNEPDEPDEPDDDNNQSDPKEDPSIEEQLQEIQQEAAEDRNDENASDSTDYNFSYDEGRW